MHIDAKEINDIPFSKEMKRSYLDYAMSVIVGRALPDARDGLKPVHRRVLYSMDELGLAWNRAFKKSARIVGDVIGKYHPHGDSAVYDTMVRMAQDFSLRYPLVDGQGNYGSIDGDRAAAMRYTEARMTRAAQAMMEDIEKDTVDWGPNYDGSLSEPLVMPCRFPNLLANGSSGIAVGMATNIPPHNLGELCDAIESMLSNKDISDDEILSIIQAPDFPTGGTLWGQASYFNAMKTGRGSMTVRAQIDFEEDDDGRRWVVKELPYQVNKSELQEQIINLAKLGKIEGLKAVRDESDRTGIRFVLELRKDASPETTLNQLWKYSSLQRTYGIQLLALVDGKPKTLTLKEALWVFIDHRREVVWRRVMWELKKARKDGHLAEGLVVALANLETFLDIIKSAKNPQEAKEQLSSRRWSPGEKALFEIQKLRGTEAWFEGDINDDGYALSELQISEILEMRLQKLTGMEQDSLLEGYAVLANKSKELANIVENEHLVDEIIRAETIECRKNFADPRRTKIVAVGDILSDEDMMTKQMMLLAITDAGYIRCAPLDAYSKQHRGGRGKGMVDLKPGDSAKMAIQVWSHERTLFLTNKGRAFMAKPWALPSDERGKPFDTLFPVEEGENVVFALRFSKDDIAANMGLAILTKKGVVKKTLLSSFAKTRSSGLNAINVDEGDSVVSAVLCAENADLLIFASSGKASRFSAEETRMLSRQARGVKAMRLNDGDETVAILAGEETDYVVTASEYGYAKKTAVSCWRKTKRGSQGLKAMAVTEKTGNLCSVALLTDDNDEVIGISKEGIMIRVPSDQLRSTSRAAQGSRLIRLDEGDKLIWTSRSYGNGATYELSEDSQYSDDMDSDISDSQDDLRGAEGMELDQE